MEGNSTTGGAEEELLENLVPKAVSGHMKVSLPTSELQEDFPHVKKIKNMIRSEIFVFARTTFKNVGPYVQTDE